ncbi:MAG: hypothetical protein LBN98_03395 [Prevotellaceae bacterium]|nr:hypothetical protein [Prevotellaceae bacterium]
MAFNNSGIQFQLTGYGYIDNDEYYTDVSSDAKYMALVNTNRQSDAINIYVLGRSTTSGNWIGRAKMRSNYMVIHGKYYNSSTVAHEMGHCLGLYHTHHGTDPNDNGGCPELVNGNGQNRLLCGDYISDTPADPNNWPYVGCAYTGTGTDSHGDAYSPDPTNFMNYIDDIKCKNNFTSIQKTRMLSMITNEDVLNNTVLFSSIAGNFAVCPAATYTLSSYFSVSDVSWSVTEPFTITQQSGSSVTVSALSYTGALGTLTATYHYASSSIPGAFPVTITRYISSCAVNISGSSTLCATPAAYTLSGGTATSWSVAPASAFSVTASNATSATVKSLYYAGLQGTLTAIVGGATVTKNIATCNNATISGPSSACISDTLTFTVTGAPSGYTWSSSSNLTLFSTSGNLASFYINTATGNAWAGIKVAGEQVAQHNVTILEATAGGINGPFSSLGWGGNNLDTTYLPLGSFPFTATGVPSYIPDSSVSWTLSGQTEDGIPILPCIGIESQFIGRRPVTGRDLVFHFCTPGYYTIKMRYYGACGYSPYVTRYISVINIQEYSSSASSSALSAYPNPAASVLYIDIGEELQSTLQSSSLLSSANVYRLQLVAVQTGAIACNRLLSSADSQLEFNVSNIPDGLYSVILLQDNTTIHSETILIQH